MTTTDFSHYATPWVNKLQDDPSQPTSPTRITTTFPGQETDITGELWRMDDEHMAATLFPGMPVGDEAANAARDGYPFAGLDVLAFYKSFRFIDRPPFPGHWGIFLLDAGLEGLARGLMQHRPALPHQEAWGFARDILLAHERYHFWIDSWALGQEITPISTPKYKRYEYYLACKNGAELTAGDLEEELANHYAFNRLRNRRFSDGTSAGPVLREMLLDAPSPYSDCFFGALARTDKEAKLALMVANGRSLDWLNTTAAILSPGSDPSVLSGSIQPVDSRHPIVGNSKCLIYYVCTSHYATLVQPFQGPSLKEFRAFLTSYLNGEKVGSTDHAYYRIDNGEKIKCPNPHDKEVRGYELKVTLFKAGMTRSEFDGERAQTEHWTRNCPRLTPKPPRVMN